MITLDASVVIAFLRPADEHHDPARQLVTARLAGGFVLHRLTLAEVLVGAVRAGRGDELLTALTDIGITTAPSPADEPLRLATLRAETGLKLPDCCALDTASFTDSPLATYDGRLAAAASGLGLEVVSSH